MKFITSLCIAGYTLVTLIRARPLEPRSGQVQYGGVNIAGFDFGTNINGSCNLGSVFDCASNGDAVQQMQHFVSKGLNTFRLPVSWQFLVNDQLGGPLDPTNMAAYDRLVRGCLNAGAQLCIIDVHNYARWNGGIVGQGGPTNDQFASLWWQIANWYKAESRVAFDIMNEPHDLDINLWATTAQYAVDSIRNAGCAEQIILLEGTDFASAGSFASRSAPALSTVHNPGGGTAGLVFNVHRYLDADGSGTHTNCVTDHVDDFQSAANWLRSNGRQMMLTETGGGPSDSGCMQFLCQLMDFINANSDVFLGVTTWAGGGFNRWPAMYGQEYELNQTPSLRNGVYVDQPLVSQCVVGKLAK